MAYVSVHSWLALKQEGISEGDGKREAAYVKAARKHSVSGTAGETSSFKPPTSSDQIPPPNSKCAISPGNFGTFQSPTYECVRLWGENRNHNSISYAYTEYLS